MNVVPAELGWIEVICGPMFSGKSEELIRRLRRAQFARVPLQAFKPTIDDRYDETRIVSHSSVSIASQPVPDSAAIRRAISSNTRVVGIDEVQFFDDGIVPLCEELAQKNVRVIVAGLDQDFLGKPFEPMPTLLAVAEYVTKQLAICMRCGAPAGRSQRLTSERAGQGTGDEPNEEQVLIGATDSYEARCRRCHVPRVIAKTASLFESVPAPPMGALGSAE